MMYMLRAEETVHATQQYQSDVTALFDLDSIVSHHSEGLANFSGAESNPLVPQRATF